MIPHSRPTVGAKEKKAVSAVIDSGYLTTGPAVRAFEDGFAQFMGGGYALATTSGLAALQLALYVMKERSDQVWLPSYACAALSTAAAHAGVDPQLLDCAPRSFLAAPAPNDGELRIGVHLFGEVDKTLDAQPNSTLIEDVAQAPGAWIDAKYRAGSRGACSIFSFYATKVLCTGSGGMLYSRDSALIEEARDLAEYDKKDDLRTRYSFLMRDMEAAMGIVQLQRLEEFIVRRRSLAKQYWQAFSELLAPEYLPLSPVRTDNNGKPTHIYSRFCLRLPGRRQEVAQRLATAGIETASPVYRPAHQLLGLDKNNFPHAEAAAQDTLSLPIYPSLSKEEAEIITTETCRALEIVPGREVE
jgi:perosamine synthetase